MGVAQHVLASGIVTDQMVRQQGDTVAIAKGVTEGLLQGAFKFVAKAAQDKIRFGTPEFVDRLVGVANDSNPSTVTGNITQQQMLNFIGVLIFVHQNQVHLVGDQFLQRRVLVNRHHGFVEHVGVADAGLALPPLFKAVKKIHQIAVLVRVT